MESAPNVRTSPEIDKLIPALIAARKVITATPKHGRNKHFGYDYAPFEDHVAAVEGPLAENGLAILCTIANHSLETVSNRRVAIVNLMMRIAHESGQWYEIDCVGEGHDSGDKAIYKAITGARKYGLQCLLNLRSADDPEKDSNLDGKPLAPDEPKSAPPRSASAAKPSSKPSPSDATLPQPADGESGDGVFRVLGVDSKEGNAKATGKPYVKHFIETYEGWKFQTFDKAIANVAEQCAAKGHPAQIAWTCNSFGINVSTITPVTSEPPPVRTPMAEAAAVQDASKHEDVQILSVEANVIPTKTGGKQAVYGIETSAGRFGCFDDNIAADLKRLIDVPAHAVRLYYNETPRGKLVAGIDEVPF